jgi:hypothetical protein
MAQSATRQCQSERAGGFTHKVGSTAYTVNIFCGAPEAESFEDKILRMMKLEYNISRKK